LAQASSAAQQILWIYLRRISTYSHRQGRNTDCAQQQDVPHPMTEDEILAEFRAASALLEGHFLLSSGRHSAHYLQCARLLMNAERAGRVAMAIVQKIPREIRAQIGAVISPAMGGIIIGHEMGRALGVDAMFVERPDGVFGLRRGFAIAKGTQILLVEDVVTTGLSSREAIKAIADEGGEVIAAAAVVDRSAGTADLGVPFFPLIELNFPTYAPDEVPEELAATPAAKPGSRKD
jgi:orotate phosphoribosyltransferase